MFVCDGRVVIFDCIEFSESLRWIDVLSETAFAVMDLEDRGRADFAHRLLNAYLERTGDYAGIGVLRYYLAYRALVRAKVACIRAAQEDPGAEEQGKVAAEFNGYLELAERYATSGRPRVIITHGASGSGKTTWTQGLLEQLGAVRIRSDVERKRLFGIEPLSRGASDEIYTPSATEQTYARLAELAGSVVRAGWTVIVDATFLKRGRRETFQKIAERAGVPFVVLDFQAEPEVLRERVRRRAVQGGDASDADVEVLEGQMRSREPLTAEERVRAIEVSERIGVEAVIARLR
jgi:predicted kinase